MDNPPLIFRTATEVAELDFPAEDADAAGKRAVWSMALP
jgi:hypothetical protein